MSTINTPDPEHLPEHTCFDQPDPKCKACEQSREDKLKEEAKFRDIRK